MKRLKSFLRTYRHALFVLLVPTLLISQASRAVPAYTDSAADPALNDFLLLHAIIAMQVLLFLRTLLLCIAMFVYYNGKMSVRPSVRLSRGWFVQKRQQLQPSLMTCWKACVI